MAAFKTDEDTKIQRRIDERNASFGNHHGTQGCQAQSHPMHSTALVSAHEPLTNFQPSFENETVAFVTNSGNHPNPFESMKKMMLVL